MRIVVKLPDNLLEQICTIPFLYKLNEIFPKDEVHLIVKKEHSSYLSLLPLEMTVHTMQEEFNHVFDAHRVAVLLKIAEVDLYFSLQETLSDNSLGKWLRSETSIGFGEGLKSLTLDYKVESPNYLHYCDRYLKLLELVPLKDDDEPIEEGFNRYVKSKDLEPVILDHEESPYLVINVPFDEERNSFSYDWIDFFDYFKDQRFFLISDQCPRSRFNILMNDFILRLPEKNQYLSYSLNIREFASMVAFSKGFISKDSFLIHLSSYVGGKTLALYETGADKKAPIYTRGDCYLLSKEEMILTHGLRGQVVSDFDIHQIFDLAVEFFKLEELDLE